MVEGARLESVYTSQGYQEFESLTLRKKKAQLCWAFFVNPSPNSGKNISFAVPDMIREHKIPSGVGRKFSTNRQTFAKNL